VKKKRYRGDGRVSTTDLRGEVCVKKVWTDPTREAEDVHKKTKRPTGKRDQSSSKTSKKCPRRLRPPSATAMRIQERKGSIERNLRRKKNGGKERDLKERGNAEKGLGREEQLGKERGGTWNKWAAKNRREAAGKVEVGT